MTKRSGKLHLNRDSVRRLTPAPRAGLLAMSAGVGSGFGCQSISQCMPCVTYDAACVEETAYCTQ